MGTADDDIDAVLFRKIKSGKYDADDPVWDGISAGAKDLIARLLVVQGHRRLTAEQALAHPWLQGHCGGGSLRGAQEGLRERQSARGDLPSRSSKLAEAHQALPVADGLRISGDM